MSTNKMLAWRNTGTVAPLVEHPFCDDMVVSSIPG